MRFLFERQFTWANRAAKLNPMTDTAPLIAIPIAPVPDGGAAEWVTGADGLKLRAALFPAKGQARGSVVLSPGRTEPIEKYFEVIGELQNRGLTVLAHDWRGQGLSGRMLSDRLKGHAKGIEPFLDDYRRVLAQFEVRLPKPWIAMGHSMGGALTLAVLAKGEPRFSACALSAPMLGVGAVGFGHWLVRTIVWTSNLVGLGGRYLFGDPASPFDITFEKDRLGHERWRWDRYRAQITACPDLALGNLTWGWLEFAMQIGARLRWSGAVEHIAIPVLLVAAGDDDRVQTPASAAIARRLPNCRYIEIEGAYHEILMETDAIRQVWWDAFDELTATIVRGQALSAETRDPGAAVC
jgi:lysophospholipase